MAEWGDDGRVDALVEQLKGKDLAIFHCMLSQQRGPYTATRFMARLSELGGGQSLLPNPKGSNGLDEQPVSTVARDASG